VKDGLGVRQAVVVSATSIAARGDVVARDGNITELELNRTEPNRTHGHKETEPSKNPVVWVLKSSTNWQTIINATNLPD